MLKITNLTKSFEDAPLLRAVSFTVAAGEIVCLLGPSGSGKTTLLRLIAGLEQPERGDIFFAEQDMRAVPVHRRGFGMMFQDLALFPHQNVFDNVAFGLRMKHIARAEIRPQVQEALELVGLGGFAQRDVNNLSGGEQQRVALARALAPRPRLLMFDEPLGALDRLLREQLVSDLRAILKRLQLTALYVTHDQDEAFAIADRIALLHAGGIAQIGAPEELYRAPANAFVAQFLGLTNLFPAKQLSDGRSETALGTFASAAPMPSEKAMALIRPQRVRVRADNSGLSVRVEECVFRAGKYRLRVVTGNGARLAIETENAFASGATLQLQIEAVEWLTA